MIKLNDGRAHLSVALCMGNSLLLLINYNFKVYNNQLLLIVTYFRTIIILFSVSHLINHIQAHLLTT